MTITKQVSIGDNQTGQGYRETTLDGQTIQQLVTRYPDGDRLEVETGSDGAVILTLVPAFQGDGGHPRYGDLAPLLAPLDVTGERTAGTTRTVELSPGSNRIQRFRYLRAVIPAPAHLEVETGYGGNPFSVRLRAA
jgi:hypothetical protein